MAFKMKGFSPFTKDGETAEEKLKRLREKRKKEAEAAMDSVQQSYTKKMQFSADSLNAAVNKDIKLYNDCEISLNELKKRRPVLKYD